MKPSKEEVEAIDQVTEMIEHVITRTVATSAAVAQKAAEDALSTCCQGTAIGAIKMLSGLSPEDFAKLDVGASQEELRKKLETDLKPFIESHAEEVASMVLKVEQAARESVNELKEAFLNKHVQEVSKEVH